ncbi:MAG: tRNA uridine-5-carboxymethylaminomethyl(34) synthesis GTPase MnmE [Nitrospiraceae bacterium]
MSAHVEDTICAIATPLGEGGIGVVRVSGEQAVPVAAGLVRLRSGRPLAALESHSLRHADIVDLTTTPRRASSEAAPPLDEALVVVMRAPHSFTAEDVVEIHCHGGPLVLQKLCEGLVRCGARLAEPGEFTKRAFLNGRLNLTQAEAVLDTIRAKTAGGLRLAQEQLRGALSQQIDRMRETLIGLLAHVEAAIDFTEEDLAFIQPEELVSSLEHIMTEVSRLAKSYEEGRMLREGVTAAIVGRPNVGKSSLLNALLGADRAIVTCVPGTTRDVLEEVVTVRGVAVRFLDTAGVRKTDDLVEHEGIKRSRAAIEDAELLLVVVDGSCKLCQEDHDLLAHRGEKALVVVINKSDLPSRIHASDLGGDAPAVRISAKTGSGLEDLRDTIRRAIGRNDFEPGETALVTRARHCASLIKAQSALNRAIESVKKTLSGEFVAVDLRGAIDALGEITGAISTDDILDRIFSEFCIGK